MGKRLLMQICHFNTSFSDEDNIVEYFNFNILLTSCVNATLI